MARSLDGTAKHLIRIIRAGGSAAADLISFLKNAEPDLVDDLIRLQRKGATEAQLIVAARKAILVMHAEVKNKLVIASIEQAKLQASATAEYIGILLGSAATTKGYNVSMASIDRSFKVPLGITNYSVDDMMTATKVKASTAFVNSIRTTYQKGLTIRQLAKELRNNLEDISLPRHNIEALARTAIQKVANDARVNTYQANDDVMDRVLFSATLDGRTSDQCMINDGEVWELDSPDVQYPPIHINCRSTLVPVLIGENIDEVKEQLSRPQVVPKSKAEFDRQKYLTNTDGKFLGRRKFKGWEDSDGNFIGRTLPDKDDRGTRQFFKIYEKKRPIVTKDSERVLKKRTKASLKPSAKAGINPITGEPYSDATVRKSGLTRIDKRAYASYEQWLRAQPAYYQQDILGKAATQKFRDGFTLKQVLGKIR